MGFGEYFDIGQQIEIEIPANKSEKNYVAKITEICAETIKINILGYDAKEIASLTNGSRAVIWGKKNEFKYSVHVVVESVDKECSVLLRHIPTRTHLRIDSYLVFAYKTMNDKDYIARKNYFKQQMRLDAESYIFMPSRVITDESELQTNIPPEIIYEIQSIHRKLDFIIKQLGQSDEENVFRKQPEEVNLSGSGMRFKTNESLQSGEYLEMKLVLPIASGVIIDLIGQVVRCNALSSDECNNKKGLYETAVTFVAINADDREFIIRYVFKRQRELLRAEEGLSKV